MIREPIAPKGFSHEAVFMRALIAWIKSITVKNSPTIKVDQTTRGTFLKVVGSDGSGNGSNSGGARWG